MMVTLRLERLKLKKVIYSVLNVPTGDLTCIFCLFFLVSGKVLIIAIPVAGFVVLVALGCCIYCCCCRKKKLRGYDSKSHDTYSNDDKDFDFCPNLRATVCNFTSTSWHGLSCIANVHRRLTVLQCFSLDLAKKKQSGVVRGRK